jgi:hypothetical protein
MGKLLIWAQGGMMPKGAAQIKPITFYGVRYVSHQACMAMNGIKSYQELQSHIERERQGLPFELPQSRKLGYTAEMGKKRYFAEKLKRDGFWKGDSNE